MEALVGERLRLRVATASDQAALVAIRSTPQVRERWRGTDLAAEFVDDLRSTDLHLLVIDPAADNTAAIRCYEKVGFHPVGVMRQYERGADGSWHDGLLLELLANEVQG